MDRPYFTNEGIDTLAGKPAPVTTKLTYRPDIDGLRALAVLLVVGYHAFPHLFRSGFMGVDIFFVISGFLISGIVMEGLQKESFSFLAFYGRRIRRIFPALFIVLAAFLILGWFTLFPSDYKQLGKHIAGGAGFVSNFVFWSENGYFDSPSETKILLHLWSLGVEEQFYLIWPFILWATWKKRINRTTAIVTIILLSFSIGIHIRLNNQIGAFYWPQTRFWELLAGALLASLTQKKAYQQRILLGIDRALHAAIFSDSRGNNG